MQLGEGDPRPAPTQLLDNLGHDASTHRAPALADREPKLGIHRDRRDQFHFHLHVVPRHHHLDALRQLRCARHVRRPEVELRTIPVEERRMTTAFVLRQVLAKPGSITPHTKFKAQAYILTKDEGGRHTPFFNGYRPQFYFRTTDVTGVASLPDGTEMVMPGDNVEMTVELITPIAMDKELRFAIREGGRTVGAGVVAEVIE